MTEPTKTGICEGCRAKGYVDCFSCSYMFEGIAARENIDAISDPFMVEEEQCLKTASPVGE